MMDTSAYSFPTSATHAPVRMIPRRDVSAGYRLFVPRGWGTSTRIAGVQFEAGRPEPMGFFVESDRDGAAAIVVSQARLPVELRLEDCVRGQCAHEGWEVSSAQWFRDEEGTMRIEVLAARGRGVLASRRRVVAFVDNGRVVMHSAVASLSSWPGLDPLLWGSAASFELLAPSKVSRFEAWEVHSVGGLHVELPESWNAEFVAAAPELSAVDANLNYGERLRGYVRVKGRRASEPRSVEQLLDVADHELRGAGIVPARHKPVLAELPGAEAPAGVLGAFASEVRIFGGPGEAMYGFTFVDGLEASVVALSPTLSEDRMGCLRTRRAFEIAMQTAGAR